MSRGPKSTQSKAQSETINSNTTQEEIVEQVQEQQEQSQIPEGYISIVNTANNIVAAPKDYLTTILVRSQIVYNQYEKKSKEIMLANNQPKKEKAIEYDKSMFEHISIVHAFVKAVLQGIEIPKRDDRANEIIDYFNNIANNNN